MSVFILDDPWTRKPASITGLRIKQKYAGKTVGFWIYDPSTGDVIKNVAQNGIGDFYGLNADISAGLATRNADEDGTCIKGESNTTEIELYNTTPSHARFLDANSRGYTIVFVCKIGTLTLGHQNLVSVGGTSNGFTMIYRLTPKTINFYHYVSGVAEISNQATTQTFDQGDICKIALSHRQDGTFQVFVNGVKDYSASGINPLGTRTVEPWLLASNVAAGGANFEGNFYSYAYMDAGSTDAELKALSINPYAELLEPQTTYYPLSTTSSGVTVTPTAGEITWNGGTPTTYKIKAQTLPAGEYVWQGVAPTATAITGNTSIQSPLAGEFTWNGSAPTTYKIKHQIPNAGEITWQGAAPTVVKLKTQTPVAGEIVWQGVAPTVTTGTLATVTPLAGEIAWTGSAPALYTIINQAPTSGEIVWAGGTPTVTGINPTTWTKETRATGTWTTQTRITGTWTKET